LTRVERIKNWFRERVKIPIGVTIAVCILPAVLTGLYYILRPSRAAMDWVSIYISAPIRHVLGLLSSVYPFSVMEVLATFAVIFFIYYIVKAIRDTSRRRGKWKLLGKRLLPVLVVGLYIWAAFSWLWNSGHHATGFAERYGFTNHGIAVEELVSVTAMFADRANELSVQVERDEDGRFVENRREMFAASTGIFENISREFPSLQGRLFTPKPMIFSWLMSITGYSGMYFALTGEALINTQPSGVFMPATVAHEHAHQLGVFAEDEATFVGILASIKSDDVVFQYAGYMSGLSWLLNALAGADADAWFEITGSLTDEVVRDRAEAFEFWAMRTISDLGIGFIDNILTNIMEAASDAVDAIYDAYLRAQGQELGIRSYGAGVDLIVQYFTRRNGS